MSLAIYASPYDTSTYSMITETTETTNPTIPYKKTPANKTLKNYQGFSSNEKVNTVLQSINSEEEMADFDSNGLEYQKNITSVIPTPKMSEKDEIVLEEIAKQNRAFPNAGVNNYYRNILPSYTELNKPVEETSNLTEKLNYMISLIENQQDDKTHTTFEDILIYFFIGIFIIFLIDKFIQVGRYVR
jgi:hypothetical protein